MELLIVFKCIIASLILFAHVDVVPDYNSVMISQEIINFVTKLINQNNIEHVIFSYDTTYQIGDFYCSVLVMKVPCFVEEPVIPVSFVLHDRRFCEVHNMFLVISEN